VYVIQSDMTILDNMFLYNAPISRRSLPSEEQ
jgi:hypothetical protein